MSRAKEVFNVSRLVIIIESSENRFGARAEQGHYSLLWLELEEAA
jgi:hypothetical protein